MIGTLAAQAADAGHRRRSSRPATRISRSSSRPASTLVNTMSNTTLDDAGVIEKFGVPPDADRRLPRADGRQHRQHSGRREMRAEDRREMARRIRHARRRDRERRQGRRQDRREPARARCRSCRCRASSRRSRPMSRSIVGPADLALRDARRRNAARAVQALRIQRGAEGARCGRARAAARDLPAADVPTRREFGVRAHRRDGAEDRGRSRAAGPGRIRARHDAPTVRARGSRRLRDAELVAFDTETDSLDPMQADDHRHLARGRAERSRVHSARPRLSRHALAARSRRRAESR